tara:strand:- start:1036 stop:1650 length:615 start_codon:yes stop_codon:yes gene_type:complete
MCNCGCNTCETKIRGPLLTEGKAKVKSLLSENLQYHLDKDIPLFESVFRIGSDAHLNLIKEARKMYSRDIIDLCEEDEHIIKTHLGEFALFEGEAVPLDLPMLNERKKKKKKEKKDPPLGKPKRGGPKAYYVYVRDPKTKKIKKVTFGSGGLRAKIKNKKARNAFAKRHDCKNKKDRTKASYWSCNLPRYASMLGLGANMNTFW